MYKPNYQMGVVGLIYGTILAILGWKMAAVGHGLVQPILCFSAPVSLLGVAGFYIGPPVDWSCIGAGAPSSQKGGVGGPRLAALVLFGQYVSVLIAVFVIGGGDDLRLIAQMPIQWCAAWGVYCVGQMYMWKTILTECLGSQFKWNRRG
jgi:hypothetical protein